MPNISINITRATMGAAPAPMAAAPRAAPHAAAPVARPALAAVAAPFSGTNISIECCANGNYDSAFAVGAARGRSEGNIDGTRAGISAAKGFF